MNIEESREFIKGFFSPEYMHYVGEHLAGDFSVELAKVLNALKQTVESEEIEYILGIHDKDGGYEEEMYFNSLPVNKGDNLIRQYDDDEYKVFQVVHSGDQTTLHVKISQNT